MNTIVIQFYGGKFDGYLREYLPCQLPTLGDPSRYPASSSFNGVYLFTGRCWKFVGYDCVTDYFCKGK